MGIFSSSRGNKPLQGRIKNKRSGIYVDLPVGWDAYEIDHEIFLIGRIKNQKASLMFSVTHLAMVVKGEWKDPMTGELLDINPVEDGEFETFDFPVGGTDKMTKVWQTYTEKYLIRFMYICDKDYFEEDIATIRQIVNSLVKNPIE